MATIRPATAADEPAILPFDAFAGDRGSEILAGHCVVAQADGQVVAYASWAPAGLLGQPFLTDLCVRPSHRRQGLAMALIRHIQGVATGRKLISSTEDWCVEMQRIFQRLGWQRVGEISTINQDGSVEFFYAVTLRG
jgi:GNAT superfamily N-acetyltransferase